MNEAKELEILTRHTEQIKTLFERLGNLEKLTESVNKMAISLERVTGKLTATEDRVNQIADDVDEIKDKPGKRWDLVIAALISGLVGAGITMLIK